MIKIIDYGLGNVLSFINIYKRLNIPASLAREPRDITNADKLILPGVGSFDQAMTLLQTKGFKSLLEDYVLEQGIPILGVCVGMQILGNYSEEGNLEGFGWIPGKVQKFSDSLRLPHMGWNDVVIQKKNMLFNDIDKALKFYFLHSFYFKCGDEQNSLATSDYQQNFSCIINARNIYGVQFHPEKSHHYGVSLLKSFAEL